MKSKYAYHLTAYDISVKKTKGMKRLRHNSEKKLFDSAQEAHEYIRWHIRRYNSNFPATEKIEILDLYQLIRINTERVTEYQSIYPEKQRK